MLAEPQDGFPQVRLRRLIAALRPQLKLAAARVHDAHAMHALLTDQRWTECAREVAAWIDVVLASENCAVMLDSQLASLASSCSSCALQRFENLGFMRPSSPVPIYFPFLD